MPRKNSKDKGQEVKTTGHEWDGIQEYENREPVWLRVLFYSMLFLSFGYWFLYPSWPTPRNTGVLEWSSTQEVKDEIGKIEKIQEKYLQIFNKTPISEVEKNPELLKFAMAGGKSAFQNNCAVCHGAGGNGNFGYPNLTAGSWLWGGKLEDIYTTLKYGIRSNHPETRESIMAAFGRDKILTADEVVLLTHYVMTLSQPKKDKYDFDYSVAQKLFQNNCASCHGDSGTGNYEFGAPNLADQIWLYGSSYEDIYSVIYNGRAGVMPFWEGKLSDNTIKQLALYVHNLGGGE